MQSESQEPILKANLKKILILIISILIISGHLPPLYPEEVFKKTKQEAEEAFLILGVKNYEFACIPATYVHQKPISELNKIKKCAIYAQKIGLEVHAGHGMDYKTTKILNKIKQIKEFNIGHFLVGESIFVGLGKTIKEFKKIIK